MKGNRVRSILITLGLVGVGAAVAAYVGWIPLGRTAKSSASEPAATATTQVAEAIAVTIAPAVPRAVERRVRTVGTLHGYEEVEIAPLVDGPIRRILHDVGDVVAPGDPLLEIDDSDFQLTVQEMSRALDLELSKLGLTALPEASFDVTTLPTVVRAQLVERNAADTLERHKSLVDRNAVSRDEFSKTELNLDVARLDTKQRLLEAEQNLAAVRHRQAILQSAQKRLRDTRVVAPPLSIVRHASSGSINLVSATNAEPSYGNKPPAYTIAERMVSPGEIVRASPPTPLFRLVVEDPLKFQSAVPERFAAQLRVGQSVDLAAESLPGRKIVGHVVRINPTIDTASRTFQIEVSVPNSDRSLKPGAFATASILIADDAEAVTVPEEAVVRFAGVTKLFVVSGDKVTAVPVELGTRLEKADAAGVSHRWVEVLDGVRPGTNVVTSGHAQLADGTAVRVRETQRTDTGSDRSTDGALREVRRVEPATMRKDAR